MTVDSYTTEHAELYVCRPPEELQVPMSVTPLAVEYRIPGGKEVAQAVRSLKKRRAGGP